MNISDRIFKKELEKMNIQIVEIDEEIGKETAMIAKKYNNQLPFKHHARDYIIGATAIKTNASALITYNKAHFHWLNENNIDVLTPEEFLAAQIK